MTPSPKIKVSDEGSSKEASMSIDTHTECLYQRIIDMGYPPKAGEMYQWIADELRAVRDEAVRDYIDTLNAQGDLDCGHRLGWQNEQGCDLCEAKAQGRKEGYTAGLGNQ